jgi:hypothetical protein
VPFFQETSRYGKYILMLPGAVPAVTLHVRAGEATCYITSALITLVVVGLAIVTRRRGTRMLKLAFTLILFVFCGMAFLAFLMVRA